MRTLRDNTTALDDSRLPVRAKLVAAWTSFMFLYVYVDIVGFYVPGKIDDILVGVVFEFDITQTLLTALLALMAVPILMVVLSAMLPARASRITNLVVASVQVPFAMFNAVGESWTYYYWGAVLLEVILLAVILRLAWTWPRRVASPATTAASAYEEPRRTQHTA
ncbi:hypothetical protein HP550_04560 [Cellulomonas humilata]|uniref:Uncharacterized protein n=1 Tax=Cellulomonas humilata TaxID=144055 RepID=A0A7Y6A0Q7_9CELL|nr:DUF6326 family protein [Cellulomonas humilata]NUU16517.1 hypothetical protein [Cellulomonas humilata]